MPTNFTSTWERGVPFQGSVNWAEWDYMYILAMANSGGQMAFGDFIMLSTLQILLFSLNGDNFFYKDSGVHGGINISVKPYKELDKFNNPFNLSPYGNSYFTSVSYIVFRKK